MYIGSLVFSRIQGCFYWLSSSIRSGVMADHTSCAKMLTAWDLKVRQPFHKHDSAQNILLRLIVTIVTPNEATTNIHKCPTKFVIAINIRCLIVEGKDLILISNMLP